MSSSKSLEMFLQLQANVRLNAMHIYTISQNFYT